MEMHHAAFRSGEPGDPLLGQDLLQMQFGKTHLEKLSACRMLFPWTSVGQSKPLDETEAHPVSAPAVWATGMVGSVSE